MNTKYLAATIVSHVIHSNNQDIDDSDIASDISILLDESIVKPSIAQGKLDLILAGARSAMIAIPIQNGTVVLPISSIEKVTDGISGRCTITTKDEKIDSTKNAAFIIELLNEAGSKVYIAN